MCLIALGGVLASLQGTASVAATDVKNPDWPCVQRKVETLTAAQMWDGPELKKPKDWWNDEALSKLVKVLLNRRFEMEAVEAALDKHLEGVEKNNRDKFLTGLFAILLDKTNVSRRSIMAGIERFQRRQVARSKKLEAQGKELGALEEKAKAVDSAKPELKKLQELYDWNVRVFRERQENIPIACEIPVIIEQRAFALARAIRGRMEE